MFLWHNLTRFGIAPRSEWQPWPWVGRPQDASGRDAVRLWGVVSQRKTKYNTVGSDRSRISGSCIWSQLACRSSSASEKKGSARAPENTKTYMGFSRERRRLHDLFKEQSDEASFLDSFQKADGGSSFFAANQLESCLQASMWQSDEFSGECGAER